MVEEPDATPAVHNRVVGDESVTLVLHGDPALAAINHQIVEHNRAAAVSQYDAVVVAAHHNVAIDNRRATGRVDLVFMTGKKCVVADDGHRRALAIEIDVVVISSLV